MTRTTRVPLFFLLSLLLNTFAQECTPEGLCDTHEQCRVWQEDGMCIRERAYMQVHCPASCDKQEEPPPNKSSNNNCEDASERCQVWADLGECDANSSMQQWCPKACGKCRSAGKETTEKSDADPSCVDKHELCSFWAEKGECKENATYMKSNCPKSCGSCPKKATGGDMKALGKSAEYGVQQVAEGSRMSETVQKIQESIDYMQTDQVTQLPRKIREDCKNRHELCSFWAVIGECTNNAAYMATNCAVACMSCHMIDFSTRCPPVEDAEPGLKPGDLNKMFERIVATAPGNRTLTEEERAQLKESNMTEYVVHIHSKPTSTSEGELNVATDKSSPPWVITFDNFLTPEECQEMIDLGYKYEYKRSEDVGDVKFDGSHSSVQSTRRTSENSWCSDFHGCRKEDLPQKLHNRISTVLGIPPNNSEDFQMLKYEPGQFYRRHHDYIPHQKDRQCGPRILTFFLYLSDVEEGGGTNFPQLDITVQPKRGRALLWPSILNSEPMEIDKRTSHQALDVEKGVKFAANGWVHMYDYVTPQRKGCN